MSVFGVILVRIQENADQNTSEYGHFSRSASDSNGPWVRGQVDIKLETKHVLY